MIDRLLPLASLCFASCLLFSTGCDCPERAETTFTWNMWSRTAQVRYLGNALLTISSNEQIALVRTTDYSVDLSDVLSAGPGDAVGHAGQVVAKFQGEFSQMVSLSADSPSNDERLLIVRLEPEAEALTMTGSVYWEDIDCDITSTFDIILEEHDASCGDGMVEGAEECDDDNSNDEDGCVECVIAPGECLGVDPARWSYWSCAGEPSECELLECQNNSTDPACDVAFGMDLATFTTGRLREGQDPGGIMPGDSSELTCVCHETAIRSECDASCTLDVLPCTTLVGAETSEIDFVEWAGGCTGIEPCLASADSHEVFALFESQESGLAAEEEFDSYPIDSGELTTNLVDANAGQVVAVADIIGEFENPSALDPSPDSEPHPFVFALDENLSIEWARDLILTEGVLRIHDVAVDPSGNTYLVGGLIGTLELEGGSVTVQYLDPDEDRPQELVLLKFTPEGMHLWTNTLGLTTRTHLISAALAAHSDGTLGLVAVLDEDPVEPGQTLDVLTASLSPEGMTHWLQELRIDQDVTTQMDIAQDIDIDFDSSGNVYTMLSITGYGLHQYEIPEPPESGEASNFIASFSPTGEHIWSTLLPVADMSSATMEVDDSGRAFVASLSQVVSTDASGQVRWSIDVDRRDFDTFMSIGEQRQRLAVDPATGDFVVAVQTSTTTGGSSVEDHLFAMVTSRFDSDGNHRWTVRSAKGDDDSFVTFSDMALSEDRIFAVGSAFSPTSDTDATVFWRIDEPL